MLTPSSNTVLEPITNKILNSIDNVTAHFSRFTVTEISSNPNSLNQFNYSKIIESAKLLADAKVDVIAWNGTSAGWLGFESDENLCKEIKKATGINATTTVLTLNEIFNGTILCNLIIFSNVFFLMYLIKKTSLYNILFL